MPPLPPSRAPASASRLTGWVTLQENFLLPPENQSHIYLFPGTVHQFHPEMDASISLLLRTDPKALVIFATPLLGRDKLPTLHPATRHDMLHPSFPPAAIHRSVDRPAPCFYMESVLCICVFNR